MTTKRRTRTELEKRATAAFLVVAWAMLMALAFGVLIWGLTDV